MHKYKIETVNNINTIYKCICNFDECFTPSITQCKNDKKSYALKLFENAVTFTVKNDYEILGFLSAYMNDMKTHTAFLCLIAVDANHRKNGLGKMLLKAAENEALSRGLKLFKLEVYAYNSSAVKFYEKNGFKIIDESDHSSFYMIKSLCK